MLYIATDLIDSHWLQYIIEEFSRIQSTNFQIRICRINDAPEKSNIIYYSREPQKGITIPNLSMIRPKYKIQWLHSDFFVIKDTLIEDSRFTLNYDLFWNSFVFLTRQEEYWMEKRGKNIHSYSSNHPRADKKTFDLPIVNKLFDKFQNIIEKKFPDLIFQKGNSPVIELSHDVDYLNKTVQLRVKQTALNLANTVRQVKRHNEFISNLKKTISFATRKSSYWHFDYWKNLELSHNKRSVFYIFVKTDRPNVTSWLIDPSYDISENNKLQYKVKEMIGSGFKIGLHGSYYSATDEDLILKEKRILENIVGQQVTRVRQHWLRYFESITPRLHSEHFRQDSSLGWNDRIGFRSGIATAYRPFDHQHNMPFKHMIVPQIIMDSNIFDYNAAPTQSKCNEVFKLLNICNEVKNAHVSISWHQRVCSKDYNWHHLYKKILSRHSFSSALK